MLEKEVEAYLVKQCKEREWLCWKFTSPSNRAVPDRIVIAPGNKVAFFELKAPGRLPTPQQAALHRDLQMYGVTVRVADSKHAVDACLRGLWSDHEA